MRMSALNDLKQMVIEGDVHNVKTATLKFLDEGIKPGKMIEEALIPAMDIVGEKYKTGEIFVPEMLVAAKTMQAALEIIKPLLKSGELKSTGKIVIGTVKGDLHDIGKNLVAMMLEGAGFEVIDVGTDVPVETFVAKVKEYQPNILGLSGLLTTTVPQMALVMEALKEAGLEDNIKVMVGGAAVTPDYAEQIGASYEPDAAGAVEWAKKAMN
jgi:5-methyltetrahydrofolate--homocysteine methyltransferase